MRRAFIYMIKQKMIRKKEVCFSRLLSIKWM